MNNLEFIEKERLDRYERAYRYVRNMAQQNCEDYTELCLRTDVVVEAIRKAQKYDKLEEEKDIEYESLKETVDEGQEIISELKEENKKLKNAIEILKNYVFVKKEDILGESCIRSRGLYIIISPEEYELLKEVLEYE